VINDYKTCFFFIYVWITDNRIILYLCNFFCILSRFIIDVSIRKGHAHGRQSRFSTIAQKNLGELQNFKLFLNTIIDSYIHIGYPIYR